jgi:hypothetical protein
MIRIAVLVGIATLIFSRLAAAQYVTEGSTASQLPPDAAIVDYRGARYYFNSSAGTWLQQVVAG